MRRAFDPTSPEVRNVLRLEPEGRYTVEAHVACFQIPLDMAFGSQLSLRFLRSL